MSSWLRFTFLFSLALSASTARTFNTASEFRSPEEDDNSLSSVRDFRVVEDEEQDDFSVGDSWSEQKEEAENVRSAYSRRQGTGGSRRHDTVVTSPPAVKTPPAVSGSSCTPGQKGRTKCSEFCLCKEDKKWHCCRVRFEVNSLIHSNKGGQKILERYGQAYKKMTTHGRTRGHYRALVEAHRTLAFSGIHNLPLFNPWHRWFLIQMENMMRRHDCRVTIPYVDWAKIAENWRESKLFSPQVLGTNGDPNRHNCVTDGPFKTPDWKETPQASSCKDTTIPVEDRCCLQRSFKNGSFHTVVYTEGTLKAQTKAYPEFECILRYDIHLLGIYLPGGTMASLDAAQAPLFILQQAYMDYLWWRYLRISPKHRAAAAAYHALHAPKPMILTDSNVWKNITGTKPGGILANEMLDNTRLPGWNGEVCVTYEWEHSHLKKKLTPEQVQHLTSAQQWAYLEGKLSKESKPDLLKTPQEQESSLTILENAWKIFKAPKKCGDFIKKTVRKKILHSHNIISADALKKDKESQRTGIDMQSALGKK